VTISFSKRTLLYGVSYSVSWLILCRVKYLGHTHTHTHTHTHLPGMEIRSGRSAFLCSEFYCSNIGCNLNEKLFKCNRKKSKQVSRQEEDKV